MLLPESLVVLATSQNQLFGYQLTHLHSGDKAISIMAANLGINERKGKGLLAQQLKVDPETESPFRGA
jgi:hypothetical protein